MNIAQNTHLASRNITQNHSSSLYEVITGHYFLQCTCTCQLTKSEIFQVGIDSNVAKKSQSNLNEVISGHYLKVYFGKIEFALNIAQIYLPNL